LNGAIFVAAGLERINLNQNYINWMDDSRSAQGQCFVVAMQKIRLQ
jgi:hypothetical protein